MIVSMILYTSELSSSHLIRATAIFVVDCCHFGPIYEFNVRSLLGKCAIGVSLLKYSSELATYLYPLYIVDDVVGVGITHEI